VGHFLRICSVFGQNETEYPKQRKISDNYNHKNYIGDDFDLFIYLAGCTMFPHLPAPIYQLHNLLPPFASVVPVFFH
jgi:hypothetical protein